MGTSGGSDYVVQGSGGATGEGIVWRWKEGLVRLVFIVYKMGTHDVPSFRYPFSAPISLVGCGGTKLTSIAPRVCSSPRNV